jgi:hypothetical protein
MQPIDPAGREAPAPTTDRRRAAAQSGGDVLARLAIGGSQHDPAAQRQRLRAGRAARPALKDLPLLLGEYDLSTRRHSGLQSSSMTTNFAANRHLPAN